MPVQWFTEHPLEDIAQGSCASIQPGSWNPKGVLKDVFGFPSFKPGQQEAIDAVLSNKDAVVVIPTGGGKTIIYTIPTLLLPGVTVVVSPLLMLMHDQLIKLRKEHKPLLH